MSATTCLIGSTVAIDASRAVGLGAGSLARFYAELKTASAQLLWSLTASYCEWRGRDLDVKFAALVEQLDEKLHALLGMTPLAYGGLPPDMPLSGVYLFTERGRHLYVGRSNGLRARHGRHCRPRATHRMASFAFQLAREATGKSQRSYRPGEGSRTGLMLSPEFVAAFDAAKARIRGMEYRYVEELDQTRQALLEIYSAVVLATPYNDFGTH